MIVTGQPAASSFAAGAAVAGVGIAFTGVAALTSQLSSTARGANGLAVAVLAVAFVVGGVGNMLGHADASGLGRLQRLADVAVADRLGLRDAARSAATAGGCSALSVALCAVLVVRRGALRGAARPRPRRAAGPDRARPRPRRGLLRPFGLAWRLQRAGLPLVARRPASGSGLIFGSVSDSVRRPRRAACATGTRRWPAPTTMLDAWFTLDDRDGRHDGRRSTPSRCCCACATEESQGRLEAVLGCGRQPAAVGDELRRDRRARRRRAAAGLRRRHGAGGRAGGRRHLRPARRLHRRGAGPAARRAGDRGRRGGRLRAAAALGGLGSRGCCSWRRSC